jgi:hypothetical protein
MRSRDAAPPPGRRRAAATGSRPVAERSLASLAALWAVTRAVVSTLVLAAVLIAASPAPSQPGAGDPRSSGQGPGLVGDPLAAIIIVTAIAVASIVATLAYVRLTRDRGGAQQH